MFFLNLVIGLNIKQIVKSRCWVRTKKGQSKFLDVFAQSFI